MQQINLIEPIGASCIISVIILVSALPSSIAVYYMQLTYCSLNHLYTDRHIRLQETACRN